MATINGIYKCGTCGNVIAVLHNGGGELVCCGKPMNLMEENSTDAAQEKHVPVVEIKDGQVRVQVGSTAHPMQEDHYIQWIEIVADGKSCRVFLKPGDAPAAAIPHADGTVSARACCNLHGLWKSA